jgi:Na+/proline symporter
VTALDLAVVVLLLGGLVLFAGMVARRQRDTDDYYLGGGRLPAWALGLSLAANQVSAISLVGAPAFVALREGGGLLWLQYELAVPLAAAILVVWGVSFLRRTNGVSVYQAVEERLGGCARRVLAGFFLVGRGLGAGVILLASARVVAASAGWSLELSLLVVGVVAVLYTGLGGLVADVVTDVLQLALLWGAVVVVSVVAWWRLVSAGHPVLGSVESERLVALDLAGTGLGDGATFAFWPMLFGALFLYLAYYGCDQTQAQRILAAGSGAEARRSLAVAAIVRFPLALTYCGFGVLLAATLRHDGGLAAAMAGQAPDALVPVYLTRTLPPGLLGLVVAGILAAALSSIDSALNSLSAVTLEESGRLRAADSVLVGRLLTVGWGVFAGLSAVIFSRSGETVIELVNRVGSAVSGPTLAVFVLAFGVRRADGRSAVSGALFGLLATLAVAWGLPSVSWLWWNVIGCAVGVTVGWVFGGGRTIDPVPVDREDQPLGWMLLVWFLVIAGSLGVITILAQ